MNPTGTPQRLDTLKGTDKRNGLKIQENSCETTVFCVTAIFLYLQRVTQSLVHTFETDASQALSCVLKHVLKRKHVAFQGRFRARNATGLRFAKIQDASNFCNSSILLRITSQPRLRRVRIISTDPTYNTTRTCTHCRQTRNSYFKVYDVRTRRGE